MAKRSVLLLGDTSNNLNMTGENVRADAWYGSQSGLHTITVHLENFTGRVYLEATLELEPEENDWFPVHLGEGTPYVEYPRIPLSPTSGIAGDTGVEGFTFEGNFLFLRAKFRKSCQHLRDI